MRRTAAKSDVYPQRVYSRCGSMIELTYTVPGMHCVHCEHVVRDEVTAVAGVEAVEVDLDRKRVSVRGSEFDDASIRAAIAAAGYDAA
jgi:copper chaperone CopZ